MPLLVSVLVSKKLSGLGFGLGLKAGGLDYTTGRYYKSSRDSLYRGYEVQHVGPVGFYSFYSSNPLYMKKKMLQNINF